MKTKLEKVIALVIFVLAAPALGGQAVFTRSTAAKQTFSTGGIANKAINIPRVGDGVLIEGQSQNIALYSEIFDNALSGGVWMNDRASIVSNSTVAPDETLTADTIHEDATAANSHGVRQQPVVTAAGSKYTASVYVKPINRQWMYIIIYDSAWNVLGFSYFDISRGIIGTVGAGTAGMILEDGWYRPYVTFTAADNASKLLINVTDANGNTNCNGLDQDSIYAWGSQIELGSFPTSYISTTTVPVTRTADNLTMDPHVNTSQLILPELFSPTGPASKVSFYGEFKCEWSSSTDIGTGRDLFSISGNVGTAHATRNQLQIDVDTNGRIYSRLYDDTGVSHYMRTAANPVNFGQWFSVRVVYDLSDFTRENMWFSQIGNAESNAGLTYVGNAGTGSWDTTSDMIRIGQDNGGDVESFCKHKNVRVVPAYIPAP